MPVDYRIDPAARRVLTTGHGAVTFREFAAHVAATAADPELNPDYTEIMDLRAIGTIDVSADQIAEIAKARVFAPQSRRAIVAPTPLLFGIARMYEAHHAAGGEATIRVFADMDEALRWLDEPAAEAGPS